MHHENLPNTSADSGQVSIVMREINKQRRHIPIRRLLKEAGRAVQKNKPVFMMSPLTECQEEIVGNKECAKQGLDEGDGTKFRGGTCSKYLQ